MHIVDGKPILRFVSGSYVDNPAVSLRPRFL
jgi:hypothetical protein